MIETRTAEQEAAEDVFFGQVVINWARWFVIASAAVFVLLTATDTTKLIVGIVPVVGLMAINFYLHGRFLAERPANRALVTVTSIVDIALITTVVLLWPGARGLDSPFFILYYPVVLAFAFVMPYRLTAAYTLVALVAYAGACALSTPLVDTAEAETLVTRLLTIGTIGALGAYYWRIQRDLRRAAAGGDEVPVAASR